MGTTAHTQNNAFRTERIDTVDIMNGIGDRNSYFLGFHNEIKGLIEEFVEKVYNMGLRSRLDRFGSSEGFFNNVKLSVYAQRGRAYSRFDLGRDYIAFVANEDGDPEMVINSLCGTPENTVNMVKTVIKSWTKTDCPYDRMRQSK